MDGRGVCRRLRRLAEAKEYDNGTGEIAAPKEQKQKRENSEEKGETLFKETRELESLPLIIEALEKRKAPLGNPQFLELYASAIWER